MIGNGSRNNTLDANRVPNTPDTRIRPPYGIQGRENCPANSFGSPKARKIPVSTFSPVISVSPVLSSAPGRAVDLEICVSALSSTALSHSRTGRRPFSRSSGPGQSRASLTDPNHLPCMSCSLPRWAGSGARWSPSCALPRQTSNARSALNGFQRGAGLRVALFEHRLQICDLDRLAQEPVHAGFQAAVAILLEC